MSNTAVVGVEPWGGRTRAVIDDHTGPTSYATGGESLGQNVYGGPNIFGLAGFYAVIPCGESVSGNYTVVTNYGGTGVRTSVKLKWRYSAGAGDGVTSVTGTGGSGMTAGTYPLSFTNTGTNGSGAAGTITVSTSAITNVVITNPGTGYTSPPTVSAATGGTPPALTAQIGDISGEEVASGTNLSGETVRLLSLGG